MLCPQTGGESQDEEAAFLNGRAIRRRWSECLVGRWNQAGWARRPSWSAASLRYIESGARRNGNLMTVFTQEDDHGHALAAVHRRQRLVHLYLGIAIEKAKINHRGGTGKMVEDRALVNAVSTPGSGKAEHGIALVKLLSRSVCAVVRANCVYIASQRSLALGLHKRRETPCKGGPGQRLRASRSWCGSRPGVDACQDEEACRIKRPAYASVGDRKLCGDAGQIPGSSM